MSDTPRTDAFMTRTVVGHDGRGYDAFSRAELAAFARELERENAVLREALGNIHKHAHCISKAGPLHTKTLADAWSKFDELGVMATAAIAATAHSNLKLD